MSARFRFVDKPAAPDFFYRARQQPSLLALPQRIELGRTCNPNDPDHACSACDDASPGVLAFVYGVIVGSLLGVLLTLAARGVAGWWLG